MKNDYSKAYYRRAICYLNLKQHQKAWNDLIFLLKESPSSQEILTEIKNVQEKWKTDLGANEYSKFEKELTIEFELAKNFKKEGESPTINKNEEQKRQEIYSKVGTVDPIKQQNILTKEDKPQEKKKGFRKIQIQEEEIHEDNKGEFGSGQDTRIGNEIEPELSNL